MDSLLALFSEPAAWAALIEGSGALELTRAISACRVVGARGEPTFRAASLDLSPRRGAWRRVIYVCHPYCGYRQFAIAGCRDPIVRRVGLAILDRVGRGGGQFYAKHRRRSFLGQSNDARLTRRTTPL